MRAFVPIVAVLLATFYGCGSTPNQAPVSERQPAAKKNGAKTASRAREADWRPATHQVQKGDTLYAIALEYGLDYKELAEWNNISAPYLIRIGQSLRLSGNQADGAVATPLKPGASNEGITLTQPGNTLKTQPKTGKIAYSEEAEKTMPISVAQKPEQKPEAPAAPRPQVEEKNKTETKPAAVAADDRKATPAAQDEEDVEWGWPAKGKVIATFNEGSNLKGIDISGKPGQAVMAAAPGKVVYSGSGLRGYGKLVIIKHNKTYLSAYAHNSQILVKEGQSVLKGQRIAEMGDSDADQVKLHFEIRRLGKPVDPIKYLGENNG